MVALLSVVKITFIGIAIFAIPVIIVEAGWRISRFVVRIFSQIASWIVEIIYRWLKV